MTKICLMCGDTFPDTISFCAKDGSALRAAVVGDHLIGEVFCDRYVVTDLLGEGGMGAVYAARDVRLPQQVAIKVLREQGMADPSTVARFRAEAEAASRINHDRVARVTDFGFMNDGRAYLIMEYVGGKTLKQTVTDRGLLDCAETSRIVTMVAEGLDAAHRLGIIHRDLKPDNVMILDDAGGGVRVKVLDFGIAKVLQSNGESAGRTQTGFVIGTPQWMSPEQILGETLDARSDVYALGLLAYTMLTGRRAFESASAEAEMMARLMSPPRALAELLPSVSWPTGLQELFNRTLSRDVSERPGGALAFAKEFANVAASASTVGATVSSTRAVDAHVVSAGETPSSMQTRAKLAASGASTASRVGSATPIEPGGTSATPSSRTSSPSTTVKRSKAVPVALGVAVMAALAFFAVRQFTSNGRAPTDTVVGAADPSAAATSSRDSVDRGAGSTPTVETPSPTALSGGSSQTTTPKPTSGQRTPDSSLPKDGATGSAARVGAPPAATAVVGDSAKPVPPRSLPSTPGGNPAGANTAPATTAHDELLRLMDVADAELDRKDNSDAIRGIMRKLELLAPRLTAAKDQGNVHFYMAMSHATLGDNTKACASLNQAEPLAVQSKALRDNVQQWHQSLRCFP